MRKIFHVPENYLIPPTPHPNMSYIPRKFVPRVSFPPGLQGAGGRKTLETRLYSALNSLKVQFGLALLFFYHWMKKNRYPHPPLCNEIRTTNERSPLPPTSFPGSFPSQGKGPENEVALQPNWNLRELSDIPLSFGEGCELESIYCRYTVSRMIAILLVWE